MCRSFSQKCCEESRCAGKIEVILFFFTKRVILVFEESGFAGSTWYTVAIKSNDRHTRAGTSCRINLIKKMCNKKEKFHVEQFP